MRVRVEGQIVLLRQMENPDQVDRIALEHLRASATDAVVVDDEIVALGKRAALRPAAAAPYAVEHRHALGLALFQLGAEDAVRSPTSLAIRK